MKAVASLRRRLLETYGTSYAKVTVVGVALDQDIGEGMAFLTQIAAQGLP